jgi:hypothetical protein
MEQTLLQTATNYTPSKATTKNICELAKVSTKLSVTEEVRGKAPNTWKQYEVVVEGQTYRVPKTVIEQLQTILKFAPTLEFFKVTKTGTTKDDTKYKVEPVL